MKIAQIKTFSYFTFAENIGRTNLADPPPFSVHTGISQPNVNTSRMIGGVTYQRKQEPMMINTAALFMDPIRLTP